jgi:PAS domain S-box-containing protein
MPPRHALALRHRLPLLICGLLLAVIVTFAATAYFEVRRSAMTAASARLMSVSGQLRDFLGNSGAQMRTAVRAVAARPAVRAFFLDSSAVVRDSAIAAIRPPAQSTSFIGTELWDAGGVPVIHVGEAGPTLADSQRLAVMALARGNEQLAVGQFVLAGTSVRYPAVAPVRDGSAILGYVVQWRRLTASAQSQKQFSELIGSNTRLYVGNTRGDLWTDMAVRVDAPTVTFPAEPAVVTYPHDSETQLGVGMRIPNTPWSLILESPEALVMGSARTMLGRFALFATVVLIVGFISAWLLSRHITRPIAEMVSASGAIAGGDYTRRIAVGAGDELGSLGIAYNDMAQSLATSRDQIDAHTAELEQQAVDLSDQAAELEITNQQLIESVEEAVRARDALEIALRDNERITAELDAALASAPVGFSFYDASLRYRRVNDRLSSITGLAAAEHIGRRPSEVIPEIGDVVEEHMQRVLATGEGVFDVELVGEMPGKPGTISHLLASYYPIRTGGGELLGVGSVVTDLTSYKELEQQFLHAQKMDAVGRLAGGIAHDFNNILTAISSFSQFAISELPQGSPIREDIEQVEHAAKRATSLTRQLLAFSRQQVLQPRVLDLNAVIRGIEPMLRRLIGEDIELVSALGEEAWPVRADPGQIEQVILNLVVNARDAMPNGGSLVIGTSNTVLDESYVLDGHRDASPGPHVVLSVTDTGVGMDAATRARMFEPFFSTKEPGRGTGLGLATVYGVVKQSGGSIWVYSEPGHGATFKVYLPRFVGDDVSAADAPAAHARANRRATVLLVEDELPVRVVARRALEQMGHTVLEAVDGRSAMTVIESATTPIELVITDLVMPGMGGRELVAQLRAQGHAARVLYMSGYTSDAVNRRSLVDSSAAYLEKPFTPDTLRGKVNEVLGTDRGNIPPRL